MPPVKRCPICKTVMWGKDGRYERYGYWTVYTCMNGVCPNVGRRGWPYQEKNFIRERARRR